MTNNSFTDHFLWKATKRLIRPNLENDSIKNANESWTRNNEQKAKRFAEHLENTFQPNEGDDTTESGTPSQEEEEIKPVTPGEIVTVIKESINHKKAPGFDIITGEILKISRGKQLLNLPT